MIEDFLTHHKRGCPEIQGKPCTCGLHKARKELRLVREALTKAEALLDGPIADRLTGDQMSEIGVYGVLENIRALHVNNGG